MMEVFNAKTQQLEEVEFSVDKNNEILATFPDGHFLKFPAGSTEAEVKDLLEAHHASNEGQEVITPEQEAEMQAQREASEAVAAKLNGNTMPSEDKTHAPTDDTDK